jgi:hypothetical protein
LHQTFGTVKLSHGKRIIVKAINHTRKQSLRKATGNDSVYLQNKLSRLSLVTKNLNKKNELEGQFQKRKQLSSSQFQITQIAKTNQIW